MTTEHILTTLFRIEEINGGQRCPTYLYRWTIFQPRWWKWLWRGFGIYVHKFVGDDWSRDLHDHPKRFISIGVKGRYFEECFNADRASLLASGDEPNIYPCGCSRIKVDTGLCDQFSNKTKLYRAPWIRSFPATHTHRLSLINGEPCWTIVIVLWHVREWGFWPRGRWVPWRTYVAPGNVDADRAKSCAGAES